MKRPRKRTLLLISISAIVAAAVGIKFSNRRTATNSIQLSHGSGLPIEVVTFNAHLLPPIAETFVGKRRDAPGRAREIAVRLRDYDLVGICEAFDERAASILIDEFNLNADRQFSCVRSPEPKGISRFSSGGLILLSSFPIIQKNTMTFSHGSRLWNSLAESSDGLAAKGAVHARVQLDSNTTPTEIDCFLTHLDSISPSVRRQQIEEFTEFIADHHNPKNAILILGDFNIAAETHDSRHLPTQSTNPSEYQFLIQRLSSASPSIKDQIPIRGESAAGTSNPLCENGGRRIDYIFLGQSGSRWTTHSKTLRLLDASIPEGSLSDHSALWCRIEKNE